MRAPLRIAMWSGPRNISTAMMRAWENRSDCAVSDEPLYAHYLLATGASHPGRAEVIAAGETDWRKVVVQLQGPVPEGKAIWYQKHMCHHLLPGMDWQWINALSNILLIRDPVEVVASYLRTRDTVTAADIGLPQQAALFAYLTAQNGQAAPVIDASDFLQAPEAHLRAICNYFQINFSERMLHWPPGARASDGIWAPHWYHAVWQSTGFEKASRMQEKLQPAGAKVAAECQEFYQLLRAHRLKC